MSDVGDFWVGDRLVRPSLGEIRLGLEKVRLEPRSISVLIALAERPREVIPKKDLIEEVWGETFVSDEVLTHAIWDLRRAFGDNASRPEFIQTIPKRGYRLIAPVREAQREDGGILAAAAEEDPAGERRSGRERRRDPRSPNWTRRALLLGLVGALALWYAASRGPKLPTAEDLEIRSVLVEIEKNELRHDPDVIPFLTGGDPRAIRDFLEGLWRQYRNEFGSENFMKEAMTRDPDFIAPWIFQTGPAMQRGDAAEIDRIRDRLDRLFSSGATGFEMNMIRWAQGTLDGSPAEQIRALDAALAGSPGNRLLQNLQAFGYLAMEEPEEAWARLEPLIESGWRFPGVYTLGAVCAVGRGKVEDLEWTLGAALEQEVVDPQIWDLSQLMAIFREDPVALERARGELDRRKKEMAPELYAFDLLPAAEVLAGTAEAEGRKEISRRIREFVD